MYLAKQGGLVTSSIKGTSMAQYSSVDGKLSATAPSHAAVLLVPALGSPGPALSPEAGGCVSRHAWQHKSRQFGVRTCLADCCVASLRFCIGSNHLCTGAQGLSTKAMVACRLAASISAA